jgi:hypothetical protein
MLWEIADGIEFAQDSGGSRREAALVAYTEPDRRITVRVKSIPHETWSGKHVIYDNPHLREPRITGWKWHVAQPLKDAARHTLKFGDNGEYGRFCAYFTGTNALLDLAG